MPYPVRAQHKSGVVFYPTALLHRYGPGPADGGFLRKCCQPDIPIIMRVGHNLICQRDHRLPTVGWPVTLERVAIDHTPAVIADERPGENRG